MRQHIPQGFVFDGTITQPLTFRNPRGDTLQVVVISSNVIRVRFPGAEEEKLNDLGQNHLYSVQNNEDYMQIETPSLRLKIYPDPLRLVWSDLQDVVFAEDLPHRAYAYDLEDGGVWHYQRRRVNDKYYGLGERTGDMNLAGRRFRLERVDCMGYDAETQDPLYKFSPFFLTLTDNAVAHGIYYHNFSTTTVDFGKELDAVWGPYMYYHAASGPLDYYRIHGPSAPAVIRSLGLLIGRPRHLAPRYAFGYLASSMAYAEAENGQERVENFAELCHKHEIPCDGMHLSSGYTLRNGDRCVFTWDKKRFPDPEGMAARLKAAGMQIFANVKPWLLQSHPDYGQMKQQKGFVWDNDQPSVLWQWRGGVHTMAPASYIDFSSKAGHDYWKRQARTELLDKGYGLWLDNNEFTTLDDHHTYAGQVQLKEVVGAPVVRGQTKAKVAGTPYQTLMMIQASYEAVREHQPTQRPFLITRSLVPFGHQLVCQTWSGDNVTEWKTIKYNVSMGVGAGLGGVGMYGHDVGGFAGPRPNPEMFVRWVQQGIFWPRFCIHSNNSDQTVTEPWMYPETLPVIRKAIQFRYQLIPYLYSLYVTLYHRACEPLIRPVFYDHQTDITTHTQQTEFMLGSQIMVAPVFSPDQTRRYVYLPDGGWYHYQTGTYLKGHGVVEVATGLDDATAPFFVKAGAILCFGKVMQHVKALPDDERRIQIFPDRDNSQQRRSFHLIEDDGETLYHETGGAYTEVVIWMEAGESEIRVGIEVVNEGYFPDYDTLWVTCPIASETRKLVFENPEVARMVDDDELKSYVALKVPWRRHHPRRLSEKK
ncbi:hypothetical protein DFQ28_000981 [Apophysomyces sp. BC1034]|nr:hypothetical protein DFQ30_004703 [Apophysomyces sp. BC1015]KAG0177911.1 hypothetical protein DFQ29_004175 [Apophysomyces sp. BC1021]KAG0191083.1 hypothetical protein DFQ28_000981 [Apophysomyces sp. BC1034]